MILLAHHIELKHYPVLLIFLAVGIWLGWQMMSLVLAYLRPVPSAIAEHEHRFPPSP